MNRIFVISFILLTVASAGWTLQPEEILVIANSDVAASVELAKYYCEKRVVPAENIIEFSLGRSKTGIIGRADYETKLARPIREKLTSEKFTGKIKCLLTTFGVPFKVGPRGHLTSEKDKLSELNRLLTLQKKRLEELDSEKPQNFAFLKKKIDRNIEELKSDIARWTVNCRWFFSANTNYTNGKRIISAAAPCRLKPARLWSAGLTGRTKL